MSTKIAKNFEEIRETDKNKKKRNKNLKKLS